MKENKYEHLTIEEAITELENRDEQLQTLSVSVEEKNDIINDLKKELELATINKGSKLPAINVDGVVYLLTQPKFVFQRKQYEANDLIEQEGLAKEILALKGQTLLVEVKK